MSYCYLSLPIIFSKENVAFNRILYNFLRDKPEAKRFDFVIESNYGSFPYVTWNGNINSNFGELCLERNFYEICLSHPLLIRYDFSNVLLEKNDYWDIHSNIILKNSENGSNQIEISNLDLMQYIQDKYPQYTYVFSKNADLINPLNTEIINSINSSNNFILINLPYYFNTEKELLESLINKNNIELIVGARCKCPKEQIQKCLLAENYHQLYFNKYSVFQDCAIENKYTDCNEIYEEIKKLKSLGFSHFKIDAPAPIDLKNFNLYLIHSLIKPEYHLEILQALKKGEI